MPCVLPCTPRAERVGCLNPSKPAPFPPSSATGPKVVLHLPLVSLRGPRQNPTLAVASRLASRLSVPLVTIYMVAAPDDLRGKFSTPRRLAFACEAICGSAASSEDVCDGGAFVVVQVRSTMRGSERRAWRSEAAMAAGLSLRFLSAGREH